MKFDKDTTDYLLRLYHEMLRIRMASEKLIELYNNGHIDAPVHLSIGQEAVAVGVMAALTPQDKIVSTHRCHAHYLAKGGDLKKMIAEIAGRKTGCCGGRGGTMHLFDNSVGHVISAPLVGASISFAVGLALSFKMRNEDKVAVAFFGDGAVEEGIFWESLNFASVHRLPVIFVCENNLYATNSPILRRQPYDEIISRVKPHKFSVVRVDGNDILVVLASANAAVKMAKSGYPCFIEARTYRIKEHWGVGEDWNLGYRSREECEVWIKYCPLKNLYRELEKHSSNREFLNSKITELEQSVKTEVDEAAEIALSSPSPTEKDLFAGEEI